MPSLAPGEARRLNGRRRFVRRLVVVACATLVGCSTDLHARAALDDRAHGTSVFTWTYDHDPERLDVRGLSAATIAAYLRGGRARAVTGDVAAACAAARRDRALLVVVAPERSADRTSALDCGVAIERDAYALVIAPR